jgi:hypothetical protein
MSVDVVLHIGCDKTGTTSIQQFLRRNRAALIQQGVLYPRSPGKVRHWDLGLFAAPDEAMPQSRIWQREGYTSPPKFRRRVRRRLSREIAASGASTVVLSDEMLFRMAPESIGRLHGLVADLARQTRIVIYVRRQDDHLVSRYQQAVKVGVGLDLATWARRDFSNTYDYAQGVARWQTAFEPAAIIVRPFERARFADGSLEQDFLDAAGLDVRAADLHKVRVLNESLGVEGVELLRILNLHRTRNQDLPNWQSKNREYVRRLREVETGPRITLPDADLDRFMAQWAESNRRIAIDHLGDASGELFRAPRKTAGTTTEQVLDPARLDDYLALLEIPAAQHDAIRRIADEEAARPR